MDRPLRSALYVPGDKPKALAKANGLDADAIIYDLEDAVAPDQKLTAREALRVHFRDVPTGRALSVIRINGFDTVWGTEDFLAARACGPDAILLPKVGHQDDVVTLLDALAETDAPDNMRVWAMIETARGVSNCASLAQALADAGSRLDCFVCGTNDLFKEVGLSGPDARTKAAPWLMQIVLGARSGELAVLDGVFNDHADAEGFADHCADGASRGFDGVSVIHPAQISTANAAYAPDSKDVENARAIVEAFDRRENTEKGVIALDGRMVERLHLEQAKALLAKHAMIEKAS